MLILVKGDDVRSGTKANLSDYFTRNYNVHSYNTCRKTDLHLPKELLDIPAQHFLICYLIACKRQRHFLLLKS